jgi:hypothetical protein
MGPDGAIVFEKPLHAENFAYRRIDGDRWGIVTDGEYCPLRGRWMSEGTSTLKLVVDRGAVRLTAIPHTLVVQYQMDGMEYVVAQMAWLYGAVGCTIAGFLILVTVVVTIVKHRPSLGPPNASG